MLKRFSVLMSVVFLCLACGEDEYTPKPKGYFRIATPSKEYKPLNKGYSYDFEINANANWVEKQNQWGDISYPSIKGKIQLTYKEMNPNNIERLLNEGRELAYQHVVKADGIEEMRVSFPDNKVHGMVYRIAGDAATGSQFFVTDSANHFLRGVVYFYSSPNADSLKPVNEFMLGESLHLIETLKWQN